MGKQNQDYIHSLYQWSGTMKDLLMSTGSRYLIHLKKKILDPFGDIIEQGVIDYWENEVDGLKQDQDALNEYYRQFPRTEEHAFRDETKNSLFNLAKIYEQIDYNEDLRNTNVITQGNFQWVNGVKDSKVVFIPSNQGRFKVSWIPSESLQNKQIS